MPDPEPSAPMDEEIELDSAQQEHLQQRLRDEQNLVGATVAGASAALAGAAIWAVITLITGYQIGFMAVGVGFLVGYSVRVTGKGVTGVFGVVGAVFALVGCLLGNLLAVTALAAQVDGIPFLDALSLLTPEIIYDLMVAYSSPIDIVFYGIAIYEGYQFSFRRINSDEIQRVLSGAPGQGTPAVRLVASLLGLVIGVKPIPSWNSPRLLIAYAALFFAVVVSIFSSRFNASRSLGRCRYPITLRRRGSMSRSAVASQRWR